MKRYMKKMLSVSMIALLAVTTGLCIAGVFDVAFNGGVVLEALGSDGGSSGGSTGGSSGGYSGGGSGGSSGGSYHVSKKKNPMIAKGKKIYVKGEVLAKRSKKVGRKSIITVKKAKGTVRYKKLCVLKQNPDTKKFKKVSATRFRVNKKTGKLTLRKGIKPGLYRIKVRVKASGTSKYKSKSKTVIVKVRVTKPPKAPEPVTPEDPENPENPENPETPETPENTGN